MIDKITNLIQRQEFYQTREQYLEELEFSQELEKHLYDPADDSVEYSSTLLEAALSDEALEKGTKSKKSEAA